LRDKLSLNGHNKEDVEARTAIRSFQGFKAIPLYTALTVLFGLMALVVYNYLLKG